MLQFNAGSFEQFARDVLQIELTPWQLDIIRQLDEQELPERVSFMHDGREVFGFRTDEGKINLGDGSSREDFFSKRTKEILDGSAEPVSEITGTWHHNCVGDVRVALRLGNDRCGLCGTVHPN